jgi:hypothetical protein
MVPEGGQQLMELCHLCMAAIGFAGCDFGDFGGTEVREDRADDPPIWAIHPHPRICWKS